MELRAFITLEASDTGRWIASADLVHGDVTDTDNRLVMVECGDPHDALVEAAHLLSCETSLREGE